MKYYWFWTLFFPIQWIIIQQLAKHPNFIEQIYSTSVYPVISSFTRFIFGWIPFSIGDVLYITVIYFIIKSIIKILRKRKINILKTIAKLSMIYFAFHLLWGLNYLRHPTQHTLKISEIKYTTEELEEFTNLLIDKINLLQFTLTKNDTIKVIVPYSKKEIYLKVKNGYDNISDIHPNLSYRNISIKHSIISLPLSYMGFSGYLNPFTGEAQINRLNPMISYPSTSCHEVAHQLGFAAENEANFIGFLTSINNDDLYFQYSGYYLALRYALNDLYHHDKERYKRAINKLHKGVIKNMRDAQEHWLQYRNPLEPLFKSIFNQYLKVNKQPSGIKSYNLMIGLLINYKKTHTL